MERVRFIYKTTNMVTGELYIGKFTGSVNRSYFGSGKLIKQALKDYGKENFTREILCFCSSQEEQDRREREYILKFDCRPPKGYNLHAGGSGSFEYINQGGLRVNQPALGHRMPQEHKEKLLEANRVRRENMTTEGKVAYSQKCSNAWSEERRLQKSQWMTGQKRKSVLEYMVDKYGEREGQERYAVSKQNLHTASQSPEAIEKRVKKYQEKLKNNPALKQILALNGRLGILSRQRKLDHIEEVVYTKERESILSQIRSLKNEHNL